MKEYKRAYKEIKVLMQRLEEIVCNCDEQNERIGVHNSSCRWYNFGEKVKDIQRKYKEF